MKTTSELNMIKSPKDAHTTFNVKRKNYTNYQDKRRAESDRITHRCPHFAAAAALKTGEIQRRPRHIESFCSGRPSFEQNYWKATKETENFESKANILKLKWLKNPRRLERGRIQRKGILFTSLFAKRGSKREKIRKGGRDKLKANLRREGACLLKLGSSEKSKAKASAHIHHWGKKVEKKAEHAYIYVKENCWVLPHSTDAAGRGFKNQIQWRVYTRDIPKQEAKMHKWSPDVKGIRKWLKKTEENNSKQGRSKIN